MSIAINETWIHKDGGEYVVLDLALSLHKEAVIFYRDENGREFCRTQSHFIESFTKKTYGLDCVAEELAKEDVSLDTDKGDLPDVFNISEKVDNINPSHYTSMVISPHEYNKANSIPWNEAQVIKYVSRWRAKNGKEDLKKALWYLTDLIDGLDATKR